jgi:hypothetical protein
MGVELESGYRMGIKAMALMFFRFNNHLFNQFQLNRELCCHAFNIRAINPTKKLDLCARNSKGSYCFENFMKTLWEFLDANGAKEKSTHKSVPIVKVI